MPGVKINPKELEEVCPGILKKNDKTFYVQCSISKEWYYAIKSRLDNLIAKHGSIEELGANYVSRDAKRSVKGAETTIEQIKKSPEEIRTPLQPPPKNTTHHFGDHHIGSIFSHEFIKCLRSDLFVENGAFCNGCRWWDLCKVDEKKWKFFAEQEHRSVKVPISVYPVLTHQECVETI